MTTPTTNQLLQLGLFLQSLPSNTSSPDTDDMPTSLTSFLLSPLHQSADNISSVIIPPLTDSTIDAKEIFISPDNNITDSLYLLQDYLSSPSTSSASSSSSTTNTNSNDESTFMGVLSALMVITMLSAAGRFWGRSILQRASPRSGGITPFCTTRCWGDLYVLACLILSTLYAIYGLASESDACLTCSIQQHAYNSYLTLLEKIYWGEVLYSISIFLSRACFTSTISVLMIPTNSTPGATETYTSSKSYKWRKVVYFVTVMNVITLILSLAVGVFQCHDPVSFWKDAMEVKCYDGRVGASRVGWVFGVVVDLCLLGVGTEVTIGRFFYILESRKTQQSKVEVKGKERNGSVGSDGSDGSGGSGKKKGGQEKDVKVVVMAVVEEDQRWWESLGTVVIWIVGVVACVAGILRAIYNRTPSSTAHIVEIDAGFVYIMSLLEVDFILILSCIPSINAIIYSYVHRRPSRPRPSTSSSTNSSSSSFACSTAATEYRNSAKSLPPLPTDEKDADIIAPGEHQVAAGQDSSAERPGLERKMSPVEIGSSDISTISRILPTRDIDVDLRPDDEEVSTACEQAPVPSNISVAAPIAKPEEIHFPDPTREMRDSIRIGYKPSITITSATPTQEDLEALGRSVPSTASPSSSSSRVQELKLADDDDEDTPSPPPPHPTQVMSTSSRNSTTPTPHPPGYFYEDEEIPTTTARDKQEDRKSKYDIASIMLQRNKSPVRPPSSPPPGSPLPPTPTIENRSSWTTSSSSSSSSETHGEEVGMGMDEDDAYDSFRSAREYNSTKTALSPTSPTAGVRDLMSGVRKASLQNTPRVLVLQHAVDVTTSSSSSSSSSSSDTEVEDYDGEGEGTSGRGRKRRSSGNGSNGKNKEKGGMSRKDMKTLKEELEGLQEETDDIDGGSSSDEASFAATAGNVGRRGKGRQEY